MAQRCAALGNITFASHALECGIMTHGYYDIALLITTMQLTDSVGYMHIVIIGEMHGTIY